MTKNIRSDNIIKKVGGSGMEISFKEILLIKDYLEELVLMYENEEEVIIISDESFLKFEVLNLLHKLS